MNKGAPESRDGGSTVFGDDRARLLHVSLLVVLLAHWPSLSSLPRLWLTDGYTHGWIVAALVGWALWARRDALRRGLEGRGGDAIFLVVAGGSSLVWLFAVITHVGAGHLTAFLLTLTAWGLAVFGQASTLLPIAGTFLLALPVWGVLVAPLREATVVANSLLVSVTGIPAEIVDNLIVLEFGTFEVADGCSGLNYLMSSLIVAAAYVHLFVRDWRRSLAVVGVAAAISIVGNWLRVFLLVVVGYATQMQSSFVDDHNWLGWVVFAIGLIPFFLIARRIEGTRTNATTGAKPAGDGSGVPRRVALATTASLLGPLIFFSVGVLPRDDDSEPAPIELAAGWRAEDAPRPYSWAPGYQGADRTSSVFVGPDSDTVVVDRYRYRDQNDRNELISSVNRIAPPEDVVRMAIHMPTPSDRSWLRMAIVTVPDGPAVLVWYWYGVGGATTFSRIGAKVLEVRAFFQRKSGAELVAVSTSCEEGDCTAAASRLERAIGPDGRP